MPQAANTPLYYTLRVTPAKLDDHGSDEEGSIDEEHVIPLLYESELCILESMSTVSSTSRRSRATGNYTQMCREMLYNV